MLRTHMKHKNPSETPKNSEQSTISMKIFRCSHKCLDNDPFPLIVTQLYYLWVRYLPM